MALHTDTTHFAGFEQRLYAAAIDMLLLLFLSVLFHFYQNGLIVFLEQGSYFVFCWWYFQGRTLGNKIMKIRVVRTDGSALSFKYAFLRYLGFLLSGVVFFLGFAWMLWDKKKQGWHDKVAKTIVIKT